METLVISQQQQQRSHYHHSGRQRKQSPQHFSSPHPMRGYHQAFNCRAFHSSVSVGILPSPPTPPPARPARNYSPEPKTPKQQLLHNGKKRSRAVPISSPSGSPPSRPELWAGPAYSNSPPPSSLPIPKFSLHQKRSVSLELPAADRSDHVEVLVHAKSAPSTPTAGSDAGFFGDIDTAIATENLRRILHLEIA